MYDFTTELIKNLSNNVSVKEIFRIELEKSFNQLLETELACFLGYEKDTKLKTDEWVQKRMIFTKAVSILTIGRFYSLKTIKPHSRIYLMRLRPLQTLCALR